MKKYFSLVLFFAVIGSSCNFSTKPKAEVVEVSEEVLVGGDEDDHGCKASAGYMWSVLQEKCIRPFELPLKLIEVGDDGQKSAAYMQFNNDSTQVELFAKEWVGGVVLDRKKTDAGCVWNAEGDDAPSVKQIDNSWTVNNRNKLVYQQEGVE